MNNRLLLAIPLAASLALLACRPGRPIHTYAYTVPQDALHQSITDTKMRDAIVKSCAQYGWRVSEMSPGTIEAVITVRNKHTVAVEIPYTATSYAIKYKSSTNMEYKVKENGAYIHPNYNNWTGNLDRAIQSNLEAGLLTR